MATPPLTIRDKAFARRLAIACDGNQKVPLQNHGRLRWVQEQFQERFHLYVSKETIRKWWAGSVKARPDKLKMLAEILEVDEAWLSLGVDPDIAPREQKARNATADGAVNVLAGFIQMGGGRPAFPEANDARAEQEHIHLYAIIKGAQYAFHVALARAEDEDDYRFTIPATLKDVFVVGAIPTSDPGVTFVELSPEVIERTGVRRAGGIDISIKRDEVDAHRIRGFSTRL